jgi:N-acetylglucosamine kinase-like BadF-type ATPase
VTQAAAAVLAIDGGNSKTDAALVSAEGSVLASVRGRGCNHQGIGRDGMLSVLSSLVTAAASAAGLPADGPVAAHTSACLAGADLPEEEAELAELLRAQGWSATTSVVNDTFAVLRAGLDDSTSDRGASDRGASDHGAGDRGGPGNHWGIGVVCGAGINCVGVAPDGRTARFLALGHLSGDWGGGGELGPDALWHAIRAEDGRGPETLLRAEVPAHFGLTTVTEVVTGVYLGKIDYSELHGLVPVLFAVARQGDQVARQVLLHQADEICVMATVAARRLGLDHRSPSAGGAVPVVLGGSLMTAREPLLLEAIRTRLAAELPGADIRTVDVPPVTGAALLGLDRVGAPPSAAVRLRAATGLGT